MPRFLTRILLISMLLSIVFVGFATKQAFAASPASMAKHAHAIGTDVVCLPTGESSNTFFSSTGGVTSTDSGGACPNSGFYYANLPQNSSASAGWASNFDDPIGTCKIEAWFPMGALSSDTKTRYDFWFFNEDTESLTWLAWPGHNINQATAPAKWNTLASSLAVNRGPGFVEVTAKDAGGSGNLAFAGIRFTCS